MSADNSEAAERSLRKFSLSSSATTRTSFERFSSLSQRLQYKRSHKMLTGNKKKRTAGKDRSCPRKYSPVPGNHAVDEEENMVTMEHGGISGGLHESGQRMEYLQVAWLLREKLSALVDSEKGEFPELALRSLLDMAASCNIVSVDPKMLNPALWRSLPKELLLLVFARLPLPDINRLRCLSREWRTDMATVNSGINQACHEASSIIIAGFSRQDVVSDSFPIPEYLVTICTERSQYSCRLHLGDPIPRENSYRWDDMGAQDGGLVCFVSTWKPSKANPPCIVVVNLLSRVQRKLPPLQYTYSTPPTMMHIEVDSETKCYRVVVVRKNRKSRPTVEIYHSGARQWTKATPPLGCIFGVAHKWMYMEFSRSFRSTSRTQSVYDFAEGQLKSPDEKGPSIASLISFGEDFCKLVTFWKDCKFVFDRNTSNHGKMVPDGGHRITKSRMQTNANNWVQEGLYLCSPFQDLLGKDFLRKWTLKTCEGFVMVFPFSEYSSDSHCGHF